MIDIVREIEKMGYEALPFCSDVRSSSDWEETLAINLTGAFNTIRRVAVFIYGMTLMKNVSGQVFNLDSRIS